MSFFLSLAVMQVSMNEHVNHIFASCILFFHRFFFRKFRILISDPLHSRTIVRFYSSLSYFAVTENILHILFLFLLFQFFEGTYLRVAYLQFTHEARNVISIHSHYIFFSLCDFFNSLSTWAYLICGLLCFSVHRKWSSS